MGWSYGTYVRKRGTCRDLVGKCEVERDNLEDIGVDWKMILK